MIAFGKAGAATRVEVPGRDLFSQFLNRLTIPDLFQGLLVDVPHHQVHAVKNTTRCDVAIRPNVQRIEG